METSHRWRGVCESSLSQWHLILLKQSYQTVVLGSFYTTHILRPTVNISTTLSFFWALSLIPAQLSKPLILSCSLFHPVLLSYLPVCCNLPEECGVSWSLPAFLRSVQCFSALFFHHRCHRQGGTCLRVCVCVFWIMIIILVRWPLLLLSACPYHQLMPSTCMPGPSWML